MECAFGDGLNAAIKAGSDTFSFPYGGFPPVAVKGPPGSEWTIRSTHPAGVAPEMKCLVILMPAPIADLMAEGLPAVRASLATLAEQLAAEAAFGTGRLA